MIAENCTDLTFVMGEKIKSSNRKKICKKPGCNTVLNKYRAKDSDVCCIHSYYACEQKATFDQEKYAKKYYIRNRARYLARYKARRERIKKEKG